MTLFQVLVLAIVQGACELLPVSSSAHVIIAERLMGLDPTAPEMTLLLVMLHTGTMLAVIAFFWPGWRSTYFGSREMFHTFAAQIVVATTMTGLLGFLLIRFIERVVLRGTPGAEIEQLFGNVPMIAGALAVSGALIVIAGRRANARSPIQGDLGRAAMIGTVQAFCVPFRGFSRSGATISTALLLGMNRKRAEDLSFALAVVLTPAAIAREAYRLIAASPGTRIEHVSAGVFASLLGLALSFVAGWLALRWLSRWLELGRWRLFGYYCFAASVALLALTRLS